MFIVPREAPGLRVGVIEDKLGLRLNQNAELIFEDCAIPHDQVLGEVNGAAPILRAIGPSSKAKEGAKTLGIGRAALDAGRQWAASRVQGGVPLAEHQVIGNSLAELAMELEAARTLVWRAAWASDHDRGAADSLSDMAKVLSSRVVVRVSLRSLELHGGHGIRRGTAAERNLRNAVTMLHATGGNDALLARLHRDLWRAGS
ncbi:MAG: hypothetical protein GEU81_07710 [Nitriliruptorales bacterium]|nr:hypothetical protein [Nitriliruptorales bacterium]